MPPPTPGSSLTWKHHTLIQALLSRGPLKRQDFHSVFTKVTGGKSPSTHELLFKDFLKNINKELDYVQLELRACRNQYDGSVYYGVVNTISDDHSKLGTKYSVPQIAFYKGIIEAIIQDASQGSISSIEALNIRLESQVPAGTESQSQGGSYQVPPAIRNFSLSQKEKTLDELVKDRWLCLMPNGNIGLGIRSFLDLRSWFRCNEVPACDVCNEAAVKAEVCQNEDCSVRIHDYCLKKKFSQRKAERVCPGCGTKWHYSVPISEAVEEDEDLSGPSQNPLPPEPSARKKPRTSRRVDANASNSQCSLTSASLSDSRRVTRSSARLKTGG